MVKKFPAFMESEGSLPFSEQAVTGSYLDPLESIPKPYILFL
jgi:hypothetical protein